MNLSDRLAKSTPQEIEASIPAVYAALTVPVAASQRDYLSCHFGLWSQATKTEQEGLERANQTLIMKCKLGPDQHVLDSGCGLGGTAFWLARKYGVRVTGITVCEPHVLFATEQAKQRGISHLVEFIHDDFMNLPFPDNTFDIVLNHESFCYAVDKLAYLKGVARVLKPGGSWRALEGLLSGEPLSEELERVHASMQFGFRMPPLAKWRDVVALLDHANFEQIRAMNLDSEVLPSTQLTRNRWTWYQLMQPDNVQPEYREFMQAASDFDEGLQSGVFTYRLLSAVKPN